VYLETKEKFMSGGKRIVCSTEFIRQKSAALSARVTIIRERRRFVSGATIINEDLCCQKAKGDCWKTRLWGRTSHKLKQMETGMHRCAFRSFTAGSFHLRPATARFYCRYDVMVFRSYCRSFSAYPGSITQETETRNVRVDVCSKGAASFGEVDQFRYRNDRIVPSDKNLT